MEIQVIISGIVAGSIYALIALCFVIVYKATQVVNFGQGEIVMIGAYSGIVFYSIAGLPYFLSISMTILVGIGLGIVVGLICNTAQLRFKVDLFNMFIVTLAIGFILKSAVMLIMGPNPYTLPPIPGLDTRPSKIAGIVISPLHMATIIIALAIMVALALFFKFTRTGKAMRASSLKIIAAKAVGINVPYMFLLIWVVNGIVGVSIGLLLSPLVPAETTMGSVGIKAFAAAIIGGFTSIPGAIVGGFCLGIIENLSGFLISTAFKDAVAFIILIAFLLIRPTGLFEKRFTKRV
jgi:branched-chain amino acid transport system permease protein